MRTKTLLLYVFEGLAPQTKARERNLHVAFARVAHTGFSKHTLFARSSRKSAVGSVPARAFSCESLRGRDGDQPREAGGSRGVDRVSEKSARGASFSLRFRGQTLMGGPPVWISCIAQKTEGTYPFYRKRSARQATVVALCSEEPWSLSHPSVVWMGSPVQRVCVFCRVAGVPIFPFFCSLNHLFCPWKVSFPWQWCFEGTKKGALRSRG